MTKQRGFTLLEIMLVLAIIAISAGIVMVSYGRTDTAETNASQAAKRFVSILELAVDRAALDGRPIGIHFTKQGWQMLEPRQEKNGDWRWTTLTDNDRLEMKGNWDRELQAQTQPFAPNDSNIPQVVILPDGQITTFSLSLLKHKTRQRLLTLECRGTLPLRILLAGESQR